MLYNVVMSFWFAIVSAAATNLEIAMASVRAMLCDLCVVLFVGAPVIFALASVSGFPTPTPALKEEPLLSQAPGLVVSCDEEGMFNCKNLCYALAVATRAKGPEILCNKLVNANNLTLSAFYKACDKPWLYADMTADESLCCEDSKVINCVIIEEDFRRSNNNDTKPNFTL